MTKTRRQNYTTQTCDHCGSIFKTARSHARYCGGTCRKAAQRERKRRVDSSHNDSKKRQPIPNIVVVGQGGKGWDKPKQVDLWKLIKAIGT